MRITYTLLPLTLFSSLLYAVDSQIEELLKMAPNNPHLLHEHSYMPEMDNNSKKINNLKKEIEERSNLKIKEDTNNKEIPVKLKTPGFTQILLIAFVIIILIVYRLRMNRGKTGIGD